MARPLKRERGIPRTLVLHSAIKMFMEKGYSNTKIQDISKDCGVTYNEIEEYITTGKTDKQDSITKIEKMHRQSEHKRKLIPVYHRNK